RSGGPCSVWSHFGLRGAGLGLLPPPLAGEGWGGGIRRDEHRRFQMQLGMIGLGRMGGNIVRRLMRHGHSCVVYDKSTDAVRGLAGEGATPSGDLAEFVRKLDKPRAVWVMLPAGRITHETIVELSGLLDRGDILIDGGNSFFQDDVRHAELLREKGIR